MGIGSLIPLAFPKLIFRRRKTLTLTAKSLAVHAFPDSHHASQEKQDWTSFLHFGGAPWQRRGSMATAGLHGNGATVPGTGETVPIDQDETRHLHDESDQSTIAYLT